MIFDPITRGPIFGSMLMCLAASLMGVFLFVRKRSLIGETLSHAAYPGVVIGAFIGSFIGFETFMPLWVLFGAIVTAFLASASLSLLQRKMKLHPDCALSLILTTFFGFGVLGASILQAFYPKQLKSLNGYLYGQVATMTDFHIFLYGILAFVVLLCIFLFYKELKIVSFDPEFFFTMGKSFRKIETVFLFLVVLSTVIGIRCVGVVLMSAMLIAPSIAARQFSSSLVSMLIFSCIVSLCSAFLGSCISFKSSYATGPTIVIVVSTFALFSLLFAPKRGLIARNMRIVLFRLNTRSENLLKLMWKVKKLKFFEIRDKMGISFLSLLSFLIFFRFKGYVEKKEGYYQLTHIGNAFGQRVVRLHRLWEVYLVEYLGMGAERVHKSAEEMEHILTAEIERELTALLKDPKNDPHDQPIPQIHG